MNSSGHAAAIMDQFISCLGRADHALLLDCRSRLDFKLVPMLLRRVWSSAIRWSSMNFLAGSTTAVAAECEEGVNFCRSGIRTFAPFATYRRSNLDEHARELPDNVYQRCAHVIGENQRTLDGSECLAQGELHGFGKLMGESHRSLRDLYKVSCRGARHHGGKPRRASPDFGAGA